MSVRATNVDGDWLIEATGFPASLNGALGHWLEELGASDVETASNRLGAKIPAPEPITGALTWLEQEIEQGRAPFEALGIAAAHITPTEARPGFEVLQEATGLPASPAPTPHEPSEAKPAGRFEEIGSDPGEVEAQLEPTADSGPSDAGAPTQKSTGRGRFEQIGGEVKAEAMPESTEEPQLSAEPERPIPSIEPDQPSPTGEQSDASPPSGRRAKLEPIGYDPQVLQANLEASVALADELPESDAEGTFDLYLTDAGSDDRRTATMLAAALGIGRDEALALCSSLPSLAGSTLPAREVRRVDAIVRPATGARFRADPID